MTDSNWLIASIGKSSRQMHTIQVSVLKNVVEPIRPKPMRISTSRKKVEQKRMMEFFASNHFRQKLDDDGLKDLVGSSGAKSFDHNALKYTTFR